MPLLDGYEIANTILRKAQKKALLLKKKHILPHLGVVFVGDDNRSSVYIHKKEEAAKNIGINFSLFQFDKKIKEETLIAEIKKIQRSSRAHVEGKKKKLTGLIVQLPLPEHLYTPHILNAIDPKIDVDCLTHENLGKLMMKWGELTPPTPGAVIEIIDSLGIDPAGKKVVVVGAGALVGKPLSILLMNARATVTVCNSVTPNLKKICKEADIIITGVGKKDLIRGNMVQKGAVVIDAGICFENGKIYGDANVPEIEKKAFITPTPGGVGPITVAKLLFNTVLSAEKMK